MILEKNRSFLGISYNLIFLGRDDLKPDHFSMSQQEMSGRKTPTGPLSNAPGMLAGSMLHLRWSEDQNGAQVLSWSPLSRFGGRRPRVWRIFLGFPSHGSNNTYLRFSCEVSFHPILGHLKPLHSGNFTVGCGKPPFWMSKSPVHGPCSIAMLNYRKVLKGKIGQHLPPGPKYWPKSCIRDQHTHKCVLAWGKYLGSPTEKSSLAMPKPRWKYHQISSNMGFYICSCQPTLGCQRASYGTISSIHLQQPHSMVVPNEWFHPLWNHGFLRIRIFKQVRK